MMCCPRASLSSAALGGFDDPDPVVLAGESVQLNHFPYDPGIPGRPAKFAQWRPKDDGWLLCGHVHEGWRQDRKQINVGVDAWHFAPVSDDTICEVIRSGPARIPCPSYGPASPAHERGGHGHRTPP